MGKKLNLTDFKKSTAAQEASKVVQDINSDVERQVRDHFMYLDPKMLKSDENNSDFYDAVDANEDKMQEFEEFKKSIEIAGILQPIRVRKGSLGEFIIVAGHRRTKAAIDLEMPEVPCILDLTANELSDSDAKLYLLLANTQRTLSPMEKARTALQLKEIFEQKIDSGDISKPWAEAAKLMNMSPANYYKLLKLNELPTDLQKMVNNGDITQAAGTVLADADAEVQDAMTELLKENEELQLSHRQIKKLIDDLTDENQKLKAERQKEIKKIKNNINDSVSKITNGDGNKEDMIELLEQVTDLKKQLKVAEDRPKITIDPSIIAAVKRETMLKELRGRLTTIQNQLNEYIGQTEQKERSMEEKNEIEKVVDVIEGIHEAIEKLKKKSSVF